MNIVISIFLIGTLVCEILVVIWLYRHKKIEYNDTRPNQKQIGPKKSQIRDESITLPPPAPETFANIRTPPRPSGGFGSIVNKDDGNS